MDFLSWLLCFVSLLVLFHAFNSITRRKLGRTGKLPPGPATIPIFGNLFQLGTSPPRSLAKLAKIHGDLMTLKLGQTTTVVASSARMAREILQKHDAITCNRTVPDALRANQHHEASLPWMNVSTTWRNLRKICNLQIFASSKLDANQHLRRTKVEQLLDDVRGSSCIGQALDISTTVFKATLNLISNTVFSINLADSSDTALEFKEIVQGFKQELGKLNFADYYFPTVLDNLDLQGIKRRMTIHFGKLMKLLDEEIDKRLELRKTNDYVSTNDFLDILLDHQRNTQELDRTLIKQLIFALFTAGTETTTTTLEWAMAELLHNPKALHKARRELNQMLGEGKMMEESDVTCLPYLQGIVKETLRLHPPAPFLLPRKAEADIEIGNFVIPKGTQLLINAWAIGRDPNVWKEPDLFLPERFIGSEIDVKGRDFGLIPFGGGRRICPGLPLAIRMLHLMLGRLIHSFDWELEDGVAPENLNMDDTYGLVLQKAQRLRVIPHSI